MRSLLLGLAHSNIHAAPVVHEVAHDAGIEQVSFHSNKPAIRSLDFAML